ncbi:MAG: aspartyl/asparaginyl beta-hydroxylase domain-containing protein [Novosphingobium sp.]
MKLARPFYHLPVLFDAARLREEIDTLPAEAWVPHPDGLSGNSAVRLISAGGVESDAVHGQMLPTSWLGALPYVRQTLASFGVVWGRSRLMRLAPGADVPEHADIQYHWHTRARVHVPISTSAQVRFHCDGEVVHMAAGEAWIFDNWRRHHVENRASAERIHLVADTSGTAAFWQFARRDPPPRREWRRMAWNPDASGQLLTECNERTPVMPAAEVELLLQDLCAELVCVAGARGAQMRAARFQHLMESFTFDWRQLCALHGVDGRDPSPFLRLGAKLREAAAPLADGLVMRTNGVGVLQVLDKRVLHHLFIG